MNKLLKKSFAESIELGKSPSEVLDTYKQHLTDAGWRILHTQRGEEKNYIDVTPPKNTGVGNELGYEVLRVEILNDQIQFWGGVTSTTYSGTRKYAVDSGTAGRTVGSFWIRNDGIEDTAGAKHFYWTYTGNSKKENTMEVYNKIKELNLYNLTLVENGEDTYFIVENKTDTPVYMKGEYTVNIRDYQTEYSAGTPVFSDRCFASIKTDLANGYISHLSITERTVALATKTLTGTYGPIYASYADNAHAKAQTPQGCIPCELYILSLEGVTAGTVINKDPTNQAHVWGCLTEGWGGSSVMGAFKKYGAGKLDTDYRPIDCVIRHTGWNGSSYNSPTPIVQFKPLNTATAQEYEQGLHSSGCIPYVAVGEGRIEKANSSYGYGTASGFTLAPINTLPDVCTFVGTSSDEVMQYVRNETQVYELKEALTEKSTVLALKNAKGLPPSGMVVLSTGEAIQYSSIVNNTLTNIVRGVNQTPVKNGFEDIIVFGVDWYLKFKSGCLAAGNSKE